MTTTFPWDRTGPQHGGDDRLMAGHGRAPRDIERVAYKEHGTWFTEQGEPLLIPEEDEDVARLVAAMRCAGFGPPLQPTHYVATKENPAWKLTAQNVTTPANAVTAVQLLGHHDDRRRVLVRCTAADVFLGPDRNTAENGAGYRLNATDAPVWLGYNGELWVRLVTGTTPAVVYTLSELGETRNLPELGNVDGDATEPLAHERWRGRTKGERGRR